ncbi:MAG TPA: PhzF family phenazine biosynthesis protein, partial [Candidatus Acidoferrum sp.]|nr:PhzF family phenazine biosynthesis protein [Candidatus Acidoferrum sp.]
DRFTLDFPERPLQLLTATTQVEAALGLPVSQLTRAGKTLIAELANATRVRNCKPDFQQIARLDCHGVIITARGDDCDFVSRFFAPRVGVNEDPVTGSAHCGLVPYWHARLNKTAMHARQLSARGGELFCEYRAPRVLMSGHAVQYSVGTINLPDSF